MFSQIPSHVASKIQPNAITGSWEWISARDGGGSGNIRVESRVGRAHRVLHEPISGPAGRSGWLTVIAAPAGPQIGGSRVPAIGKKAFPRANLSAPTTAVQVRGVLAERVIVSSALDPFLSLKALANYSGLSRRKLRDYLADPTHPLPCYRIGGKILVRRSEYDAWAASYRQVGQADVDRVVSDVLKGL